MKKIMISSLVLFVSWAGNTISAQGTAALTDSVEALYAQGKYAEALPYAQEALRLGKMEYGENSAQVAEFTNNLAAVYQSMGEYKKAKLLYLVVLKIDSNTIGIEHRDFAVHLSNFAALYKSMGKFTKAEKLLLTALKVDSSTIGTNNPEFAKHLNHLAETYYWLGKYQQAEHLYLSVLKIDSVVHGIDHPEFAMHLNNLAVLYRGMGGNEKVEALFVAALKIDSIALGTLNVSFARDLHNLADLYLEMGEYEKAELHQLEGLKIDSIVFGSDHPNYATDLNSLALLYERMGEYEKAEQMYSAALDIIAVAHGTDHPIYARYLNNLAFLYHNLGEYKKAIPLYLEALKIDSATLGTNHPSLANVLNNLAFLYENMGEYKQAKEMHLAALKIDSVALGTDHPVFGYHLNNLAYHFVKTRMRVMIGSAASPAFVISRQNAIRWMNVLTGSQRTAYWCKHGYRFFTNHMFIFAGQHIQADLAGIGYESSLLEKGILVRSDQAFRGIASGIRSEASSEKLENLQSLIRRILKLNESSDPKMLKRRTAMENQAEALQKELVCEVPEFKEYLNELKVTWSQVRSRLDGSSAAIEFVHFPFFDGEKESGYWYGAYILKKGDTLPKFVGLCPADTLQNTLGSERETRNAEEYVDQQYGSRGVVPGRATPKLSQKLYDLVWEPLDSMLEGIVTVYFAPAGILHNVAFAALPVTERMVLSDGYRLVQMGTTGTLARGRKDLFATQLKNAALFGGMDYDLDSGSIRKSELAIGLSRGGHIGKTVTLPSGLVVSPWMGLAGTQKECDVVAGYLKSIRIPAVAHTGAAASEGVFGALEGEYLQDQTRKSSPTLIHVATHGFSIPIRPRPVDFSGFGNQVERFHWSEDPLRRAGLIFSGANHVWTGNAPTEGLEDGILTAAEIALMDLSDTRLVVLSACQTGLGDIVGNEGVFGLQRAFKLAGVELVIASLWRVPDKETAEFMGLFYGNFVAGMEVREAFRGAQEVMKERYRGEPFKWGAFVLME